VKLQEAGLLAGGFKPVEAKRGSGLNIVEELDIYKTQGLGGTAKKEAMISSTLHE
jgi:hypothetical protein